jgi:hypothetical protein
MQRSRTRYAPPRSLAAPAGPAQATSACLQPARIDYELTLLLTT